MQDVKSVIFDVDGTLASAPAGNAWLEITKQLGANMDEHTRLYEDVSENIISLDYAKSELIKLWRSTGQLTKQHVASIADSIPFRSEAKVAVEYLISSGYQLCLITSAPGPFAENVAERLDINEFYASDFIWNERGELVDFHFDPQQDRKKLAQFKDYLKKKGLAAKQCVVVGDGWNDCSLFAAAGRAVAIRPVDKAEKLDQQLEKLSWKVIDDLSELRKIF